MESSLRTEDRSALQWADLDVLVRGDGEKRPTGAGASAKGTSIKFCGSGRGGKAAASWSIDSLGFGLGDWGDDLLEPLVRRLGDDRSGSSSKRGAARSITSYSWDSLRRGRDKDRLPVDPGRLPGAAGDLEPRREDSQQRISTMGRLQSPDWSICWTTVRSFRFLLDLGRPLEWERDLGSGDFEDGWRLGRDDDRNGNGGLVVRSVVVVVLPLPHTCWSDVASRLLVSWLVDRRPLDRERRAGTGDFEDPL